MGCGWAGDTYGSMCLGAWEVVLPPSVHLSLSESVQGVHKCIKRIAKQSAERHTFVATPVTCQAHGELQLGEELWGASVGRHAHCTFVII